MKPQSNGPLDRHAAAMMAAHPGSHLEFWFFKVNAGPVALLVDWIALRQAGENWLRVSIHSPDKRAVMREKQSELMREGSLLSPRRTVGRIEDVEWDLEIQSSREWIQPDVFPAAAIGMLDLALVSAPLATFSGWIRQGGQRFQVKEAPGMLSHYWGRQLASEWWWVSASQFDQPGVVLECSVIRSGVFGAPLQMPIGYVYLREAGKASMIMAPLNLASVKGTPEKFEVEVRRIGAEPIRLLATGRAYGDLGNRILNTLVGDLEVRVGDRLVGRAVETAGLERRAPA